jgi:predicted AAA+ superfamily ATPase
VGSRSPYEIAEEFYLRGGELLCLDEIHKCADWARQIKSIVESFPKLTVLTSGSSALEIRRGSHDLSRRAIVRHFHPLSFREFAEMSLGLRLEAVTLDDMLSGHEAISVAIRDRVEAAGAKVLALFERYVRQGYYPFFAEYPDDRDILAVIEQGIHTTLESDLPAAHPSLTGASVRKIKQVLAHISSSVPFTPDMNKLKQVIGIGDERTLKTYIAHLEDAEIIRCMRSAGRTFRQLEKPEKIYLSNPSQMFALQPHADRAIGTIRETFFAGALANAGHDVTLPARGDFLIDGKTTFEVGGKNKDSGQIRAMPDACLAVDGIETGTSGRIPLWLFGFLY